MGVVFSCWRDRSSDEDEALLRHQHGYGSGYNDNDNEEYSSLQQEERERERKARIRDDQLRKIVANTNDKLIDISMIDNSGIVVQSGDLDIPKDTEDISDGNEDKSTTEAAPTTITQQTANSDFIALDTKTELSDEMKQYLRIFHKEICEELEEQLRITPPGDLTMAF
ncbi:hypothetical protein KAFR_0D03520 [Kazachstania africana CBS 2517]|uniref:Uncharacterized protein n=1 Tax=Kazachstania africana (strain ATCC 22294 / BCRC 22015 / CBS 2517 / CECT 1963 / NBRC 1671 / NRRL Y-8276) TaxID=1071382 RepID=H2AUF0_KAZAF|nr:hypothetical protein KAFR_0D03520 [Kazachstania africana CBS 2517]CCF58000.1 hypothetical protein KAFR_0D03520 [Kazachstania africana CBS 2517]